MSLVLAVTPAVKVTFGLVIVFFVFFPLLLHGLIGFAVGQSLGEREENREYLEGRADEPR